MPKEVKRVTYDLKVRQNLKCFADSGYHCLLLKGGKKNCETCNFYKPKRDYELDQERAIKRLKTLDKASRLSITEKYGVEGIV